MDFSRDPNPHCGFGGGGVHFCLGSNLAKSMLRALFHEILTRIPDFRATNPKFLGTNFMRGITHLDFAFTPEQRRSRARSRRLMRTERLVVVGASLAGLRGVEAARKADPDVAITLVGAETHLPYDRPPLSKAFLDVEADTDGAPRPCRPSATRPTCATNFGVDLRLGTRASALASDGRLLILDGDAIPYSALVVATGTTPRTLPGAEAPVGVHCLRTLDDALAIRAALDAGARTVVVGAGFIGSEVASAARKRGLPVPVLESLPTPLVRSVGAATGAVCAELHLRNGTDLRCGVGVARVRGRDHVESVLLDDGTVLAADLVVVGIGVRPATDWLRGSGIELDARDGGIVCDATLATNLPGVYAAGDVAHFPHPVFDGLRLRLEHWTNAAEQGAAAALNALNPLAAS